MHVAVHALRRGNGAGEPMLDRMAGLVLVDGGVRRLAFAVAAERGIDRTFARLAAVGVNHMTAGATRLAIVARLVVGAHEPHGGVVEPGLVDIEYRNGDTQPGAGAAI